MRKSVSIFLWSHGKIEEMEYGGMNMKKKIALALLPLLACFQLTGCNSNTKTDSSASSNQEVVIKKAIVVLKADDREYLAVGETNQLTAYCSGTSNEKFVFKSLDESRATVDDKGLVTALNPGDVSIQVSLKSDPSVKKTVNFTVVNTLLQSLPDLQAAFDDIKSYDYQKGVDLSFSAAVSLGDISLHSVIGGKEYNYSIYNTYENPISVPLNFQLQHYEDENKESHTFLHGSMDAKAILEQLKGNLPEIPGTSTGTDYSDLFDSLYFKLANQFCPDSTYLRIEDFDNFYGFDFYSYGKSDTYVMMTRNFGTDTEPDIRPFYYEKGNLLNLLSPFADEILGALLRSATSESTGIAEDKLNEFINKLVPGASIDADELFTPDGMLFMQTVLKSFIETEKDGDLTTIKLNKKAMEKVQTVYSEYVTKSDFSIPLTSSSSSSLGDFSLRFSIPKTLDNLKIVIDNSLKGTHSLNSLSFVVDGQRTVNEQAVSYPFVSLKMDHPNDMADGEIEAMKQKLIRYQDAFNDIPNLSSSDSGGLSSMLQGMMKTDVSKIIEKANQIHDAEKVYGADLDNKNLQNVKNELMTYYYSDALKSQERQDLLYPLMNRLNDLDFEYQDYYALSYSSLNIEDKGTFSVNHFVKGKEEKDLSLTYTSSDSNVISVDDKGNLKGHMAYYNGKVNGEKKEMNSTSTITIKDATSGKKFEQTFTYVGESQGYLQTKTTFKDGIADFDYENRELSLDSQYDLSTLLTLPSEAKVSFALTDILNTKGIIAGTVLKKKPLDKLFKVTFGGIVATVTYTENGVSKEEKVVFYYRFR